MDPPAEGSSGTASPVHGTDARLAALCNRMGRLWSEQKIEVCDVANEGQIITVATPLQWKPLAPVAENPEALDDTHLQETPIFIADEPDCWALVAGPKQPPSYK